MTVRRARGLLVVCLAALGCILILLALAARSGCLPSTVVAGLAISFIPYAGLLSAATSLRRLPPLGPAALALLCGAPLLLAPPVLSDDLYRYLWEGRMWIEGFNPYRLAPEDLALSPLRDELWANINNPAIGSIYPPFSQLLFVVVAWFGGQVWMLKLLALLAHVGTAAFVARIVRSPRAQLAIALNPLLLSEAALNGHLDILCGLALLVTAWALAQQRYLRASIAVCAAVGLKLVGLAFLPLFARRPKIFLGTALASLLLLVPLVAARAPADPVSGAGQFASRWRGNDSLFALVDWASGLAFGDASADLAARAITVLLFFVVCALVVYRRVPSFAAARALIWSVLLLSPQVHPWYLAWLLPLELLAGGSAGFVWSAAILCAYAPLDLWVGQGVWRMPPCLQAFEYSIVTLALILDPRRPTLQAQPEDRQFLL
ncbi:MAG: DUF2029 domain-containing protein [Myxococcales bacterium]|nr:DUF2029 domain-containing protein [Myxococcales bacterium]NNK43850.1 DUF2029 domain-containing protein [Myxococcales bacterium]